ncbi:AAA family ATPase [Terrabacter carboxydivorans]|uniref:Phosphotransferase n=1 Tax=Terrabacter carboxydivorans TaxID=619730 RepID=A0ABN3KVR7_9MICO
MTAPDASIDRGGACLLVTGAPGSGKSTVTRLVAAALTRSALMRGDDVSRLVVSGHVWALGEPADEAARQTRLCNDNLIALAGNFVDAGITPVIDWIVPDRAQLDLYVDGLVDRGLVLVVLDPGTQACRDRDEQRHADEQFAFDGHDTLVAGMRDGFGELGWWFDTSALTPEETAQQVVDHAYGKGLVTRRRGL